jgi:hypothetical protein
MKSNETILGIIFGLLSIVSWIFPSIELEYKIIVSAIALLSILFIFLKERLSYYFRKNWHFVISFAVLSIFLLLFRTTYPNLFSPALILLLTTVTINLLFVFKYRQLPVYKEKELITTVVMNSLWVLNHWKSNCARIENNKMIFTGTETPLDSDGSHIDLIGILRVGSTYEISASVKSERGTDAKFQLWCHDKIGDEAGGESEITHAKTPSSKGEIISLVFKAQFNKNIRIHLQYIAGRGQIEAYDVKIYKLRL